MTVEAPAGPAQKAPEGPASPGTGPAQPGPALKAPDKSGVEDIPYDPQEVSDPVARAQLEAIHRRMQATLSKKTQALAEKEVYAKVGLEAATNPDFAATMARQVAQKFGRRDLLEQPGSSAKEEKISAEDLTPERFPQYLHQKIREANEEAEKRIESKFHAVLSVKDAEIRDLKIKTAGQEFPLASEFSDEIKEAQSKYQGMTFEDAYNLVTAPVREQLALKRAKDVAKRELEEAQGSFTERGGVPPGQAETLNLPKGKASLYDIDRALEQAGRYKS